MPRIARIVVAGLPEHIAKRGNNRLKIGDCHWFLDPQTNTYAAPDEPEARPARMREVYVGVRKGGQ